MLHTPVAIYTRRHAASRKCSRHWTRHSRRSNIKSDSIATMQIYEQAPCFTGGACLNNLASRLRDKCVSNDRKACGHYVIYLGQAASPVRFTRRKHRGHADDEKKSPIDRHLQQLPKTTTPPQRDLPKVIVSPPQKIHSKPNACCLVAPCFRSPGKTTTFIPRAAASTWCPLCPSHGGKGVPRSTTGPRGASRLH